MPVPVPHPEPAPGGDAGRFTLGDAIEHRCRVVTVADGGVVLEAAVPVAAGEQVVAYLDRYGRVAGRVSASAGVTFTLRPAGHRPLLRPRPVPEAAGPLGPTRRDERIVPRRTRVVLGLPGGRRLLAHIVDLSRSGVCLTCAQPLAEGTAVTVGSRGAVVLRRVHGLHGLAFDEPLPAEDFGPDTVL